MAEHTLDLQIEQWRNFLRRRQAIRPADIAELEDHLRNEVADLEAAGLKPDEAFLVAVKRMGALDSLSNEFAREHSERLWKQLVVAPAGPAPVAAARHEGVIVFALAVAAAVLLQVPRLLGLDWQVDRDLALYARNAGFFVLPLLAGYFAWKRGLDTRTRITVAASFAAATLLANVYTFEPKSHTFLLAVMHLPIALWLLVGLAYAGGRWGTVAGRMDFVRFSGELFIYYVLIALGGGVLVGFTMGMFHAIGINPERLVQDWVLPSGIVGAVIVAAWLVEAKQSVIENMAPVLTRLFTPMFTLLLLAFLATMAFTGRGIDRNALIAFDLLLVLVVGLLLYSLSARDPDAPPGSFDWMLVLLLLATLLADTVALISIAARISEFGSSPNRMAALGENVILLVNLAWSAVLYVRFLRGRGSFASLERWQTDYLPVYAGWAAVVVLVFPPLFAFK